MSIINQMLRDLDARHASANERAGLPASLRSLPPEQRSRPRGWLLLLAGVCAGALIAWFIVSQQTPPPVATQSQAVMPAPATVPDVAAPAPAPQPASEPPPAPAPASAAKPAPTSTPKPVQVPQAAPAVAKALPAAPVEKPAPAVAPPAPTVAPAVEGRIDKQPKGGHARELAEAEYRKGMQAANIGDVAAALPALRRALEIDPGHAKARQALLSVLASSRQWEELKQVAQAGLALDPARPGWASILARLQHEQGDTEGAVKTLETHAAHAAGDADYQGLFAFLLQKQKRHAEAAQRYQAALELRPGEGRWWFGLGLALDAAGRADEARTAYGKARDSGNLPAEMLGVIEQKLR